MNDDWTEIGHVSQDFNFMVPAPIGYERIPETRWQAFWRWLRRKSVPYKPIYPEGTFSLLVDAKQGDTAVRYYYPHVVSVAPVGVEV